MRHNMNRSPRAALSRLLIAVGIVVLTGTTSGCGRGLEVTPEAIKEARQLWAKAGIRDYDLEWTVAGSQSNHYYVTIHGAEVRKVESIRPDGQRITLKPGDPRFYSVDGLFLTIADELAQLKTDHPFSQPKGTRVAMRFQPDPQLGYPRWYRRDVMGTSLSIAIDVIKLAPGTATLK